MMNSVSKLPAFRAYAPVRLVRSIKRRTVDRTDVIISLLLTIAAAVVRLWQLGRVRQIIWDERWFGKFGAMYLNSSFIYDTHPPLGKLVVALAEHWAGHNGTFGFNETKEYPDWVNYAQMRTLLGVFGVVMIPLAYLTCRRLRMTREASLLAATFVMLDNALCLMTRLITLDSMLLAFTALALYCLIGMRTCSPESHSLVGVYAAYDTIEDFTDSRMRCQTALKRLLLRATMLIAVPLSIYVCIFRIHYAYQTERGYGEHEMPVEWQAQLPKNRYNCQPGSIAYGASLKIKNEQLLSQTNVVLQSTRSTHNQTVSCERVITGADWWSLCHPSRFEIIYTNDAVEYVNDGDVLVVRNDISHKILAADGLVPGSAHVAVFGNNTAIDDALWKVEIVANDIPAVGTANDQDTRLVHPISTRFRLRHMRTQCVLAIAPNAGSNSTQVTCVPPNTKLAKTNGLWRVELNVDLRLGFDNNMAGKVRTSFFRTFFAQQRLMAKINSGLIEADPERHDDSTSSPWEWPLLLNPMRMTKWDSDFVKGFHLVVVYEIGNPLLWWLSAVCCIAFPMRMVLHFAKQKRQHVPLSISPNIARGGMLWLGWVLHYVPFYFMGRVLYLHHYLPALYFALLLAAHELDTLTGRCTVRTRRWLTILIITVVAVVFWIFRQCTYGWKQNSASDLAHLHQNHSTFSTISNHVIQTICRFHNLSWYI
ncbi:Protein O-mannosyltransferase 2 [Coemansia sp. RSA 2706]|nr:Protein O-mannosyltransferase 2 [Coemansia sp. RSA 2706]